MKGLWYSARLVDAAEAFRPPPGPVADDPRGATLLDVVTEMERRRAPGTAVAYAVRGPAGEELTIRLPARADTLPNGTRVVLLRSSNAGGGRPAGWVRAGDLGTVVAADATQVLVRPDRHPEATAVCDPGEVQAYPPPLRCPACGYGDDHFDTTGGGIACGRCLATIRVGPA